MGTQHDLDRITALFTEEMGDNLVGVYLHGSLAMGCFNPKGSDIDVLVVAYDKLSKEQSKRIAQRILALHDSLSNPLGIEVSIVLESCVKNFVYPTPFEFHYSDYHRERYRSDENYLCGGFEDPDLAAHIVVTYHRGVALYGKAIREVFQPIDREFYIHSILCDVEGAPQDILESPVYYTLNLCRVLYFLKEGAVASKKEGGEWGLNRLPVDYHEMIRHCLDEYNGVAGHADDSMLDNGKLTRFADYMLNEINKARVE